MSSTARDAGLVAVRSWSVEALAIGFLYSFAALGVVQKYVDTAAAIVVLLLAPVAGMVGVWAFDLAGRAVSARQADVLAGLLLAVAVVALLVVYPHANTHAADTGTDRDDAATIGARGFLDGENPYGRLTYLHQPVSQLPVLLVVAMPFTWLLHWSAHELVLFLPLLYLLFRWLARDPRIAVVGLAVALASPALLREYLTGGDLIVNVVLVAAGVHLVWRRPASLLAAALLGVALATRANFLIVLVPLAVAVYRRSGLPAALRGLAVSLAVFGAIVVPVALSEGGRTALSMNDKLSEVPGGAPLVLTLVTALAVVAALRTERWRASTLWWQVAGVQALFLLAVVLTDSVRHGRPDFFWLVSSYGVVPFLLGVAAVVARRAE
jgi:hypothetical protein